MKISVLIDNKKKNDNLTAEWGLAVLVDFKGTKYLLDTGRTGKFVENAKIAGINISDVSYGILSHGHYDHSDGMETFFKENKTAKFYLRQGLAENTYHKSWIFKFYIGIKKGLLKKYADRICFADGDFTIAPEVYLIPHKTPGLEEKGRAAHLWIKHNGKYQPDNFYHEQSLVFDTEKGLVIMNSCSHGGADNIVKEVQMTFPEKKIYAILGGFHLFCLSDEAVKNFAESLKTLGVEKIYTGHCTGDHAFEILREVLGEKVQQLYTGMEIDL